VPGRQLRIALRGGALSQGQEGVVVGLVRRARHVDLIDRPDQLAELGAPVPGAAEREQRVEVQIGQSEQVLHRRRRARRDLGSRGGGRPRPRARRRQHCGRASAEYARAQQRPP
jgi:hypothetical protein